MLSDREKALVKAAIGELMEGRHVPSHEFLCDNDVTLDEAYTLAEHLALGATMLIQASDQTREGGLAGQVGMDRIVQGLMGK